LVTILTSAIGVAAPGYRLRQIIDHQLWVVVWRLTDLGPLALSRVAIGESPAGWAPR
jgi:hypothetical protein